MAFRKALLAPCGLALMLAASSAIAQTDAKPSAVLQPTEGTFWQNELFPIEFRVMVPRASYQSMVGTVSWKSDGLDVEDWSSAKSGAIQVDGVPMVTQSQTTRGYAPNPGELTLPSATQSLNIRGARTSSFNQGEVTVQVAVASEPSHLTIRPLPQPFPEEFSRGVGEFQLNSTVSGNKINVGESVTWTLELTGLGNWPAIRGLPARTIAKSFEIISPGVRRTSKDGAAFDASMIEDLVLVPRKPGNYTLGPVTFVYFDPAAGEYKTLTTPTHELQVIGVADPAAEGMPDAVGVAVPESPPVLSLDAATTSALGRAPMTIKSWWILGLAPLGLLIVFWLGLAARRRHETDPLRDRRLARKRALALLRELKSTPAPSTAKIRDLLFNWEREAAAMLGFNVVAPNGEAMIKALQSGGIPHADRWVNLWRQADQNIFSAQPDLTPAWIAEAEAACHQAAIANPPIFAIFLPRNLLPFAAAAALALLVLGASPLHAENAGLTAYQAADFPKAVELWTKEIKTEPLNAHLHYNRSLALAQLDRWSESASEALVALCLSPRDPAIRWQLTLSLDRAGIDHPAILNLAHRPGIFAAVTLFSVGDWGLVLGAASLLICVSLGTCLWLSYRGRRFRHAWWPLIPAVAGLLVVATAIYSRQAYGLLGRPDTAIVTQTTQLHSVPTEANSLQKTVPLPAGSLAVSTRTFFGWTQLAFPNGQTGWVLTDKLIWIYR